MKCFYFGCNYKLVTIAYRHPKFVFVTRNNIPVFLYPKYSFFRRYLSLFLLFSFHCGFSLTYIKQVAVMYFVKYYWLLEYIVVRAHTIKSAKFCRICFYEQMTVIPTSANPHSNAENGMGQ